MYSCDIVGQKRLYKNHVTFYFNLKTVTFAIQQYMRGQQSFLF